MTLLAEIQKHQQWVSDLKRQVEQITALAGEDWKAGIPRAVAALTGQGPAVIAVVVPVARLK